MVEVALLGAKTASKIKEIFMDSSKNPTSTSLVVIKDATI